jgi:hypothetical protein
MNSISTIKVIKWNFMFIMVFFSYHMEIQVLDKFFIRLALLIIADILRVLSDPKLSAVI